MCASPVEKFIRKFDPKYKALAKKLVEQLNSEGLTAQESKLVLDYAKMAYDRAMEFTVIETQALLEFLK